MTSCPITPPVQTFDTPHTQLGDMQRQHMTIDLDGCNLYTIVQAMNEFDRKRIFGMRFEQWPGEIQTIFTKEIDAWLGRNPGIDIRAYTISVHDGAFMVALHWKPKS